MNPSNFFYVKIYHMSDHSVHNALTGVCVQETEGQSTDDLRWRKKETEGRFLLFPFLVETLKGNRRTGPQPQSAQPALLSLRPAACFAKNRARTASGIPASRTAHDRTPLHFCLRQTAHWADVRIVPPVHARCTPAFPYAATDFMYNKRIKEIQLPQTDTERSVAA